MEINWRAPLTGALLYLFLITFVGDLLINSVGENVGPVTDMVITSLILLMIVYVSARKSGEGQARMGGLFTGGLCFLIQLVLSILTVGMSWVDLFLQIVLFGGLAILGGFVAERL